MPNVVRHADVSSGHCFSSRPNAAGSPTVFVNDLGIHRMGDPWNTHCCGPICHGGVLAAGSPTVFADQIPVGRIGDPVSCGDACATGSPNVFADEGM